MFSKFENYKKLKFWQFVGILLTLLWIAGALFYEYSSSNNSATNYSDAAYGGCTENLEIHKVTDLSSCIIEKQKNYSLFMKDVWTNAFVLAFLPLPIFWIYGFILLNVSRCFSIGSKVVFNLGGLSKLKKSFYYFCYGFSGLTVFFVSIVLMHLYADSKVPASLGYRTSVIVLDGYVTAKGTWTNDELFDKSSSILFPQQISKIVCRLEKRQCVESRAMISHTGGSASLMTDLIEYDIKSWTKDSIVFVTSGICYDEIYTLDLNSKTVNGVEKFSNHATNNKYCNQPEAGHVNTTFRLANGYAVYRKLKREASPWLLKIVFSLFGG